jgi:outer membrane murein-binding lipoprotein Lpp
MDNQLLNQILQELRSLNTKIDKLSEKMDKQQIENINADNLLLTEIIRVENKHDNNHNEIMNALHDIQKDIEYTVQETALNKLELNRIKRQ